MWTDLAVGAHGYETDKAGLGQADDVLLERLEIELLSFGVEEAEDRAVLPVRVSMLCGGCGAVWCIPCAKHGFRAVGVAIG